MRSEERDILPIKERIAQFRMTLDGRSIPIGVGCAWMTDCIKDGNDAPALLRRCYDEGFRFFDTASDYGDSEDVVGAFLRGIDRKSVFLSTKSPYYGKTLGAEEAFPKFREAFYRSFDRLGTEHIDLYLIHDTNNIQICEKEVLPFLQEQREKGLIDYFGMGTRSLQAHEEGICTGAIQASENYLTYSILKRSAAGVIRMAAEHGVAWINASPLHFGKLKDEDPLAQAAVSTGGRRREWEMAAKMQALCREMGVDIIAAALQYSLLNPDVDMSLNGIRRPSNLESTLRALRTPIYPDQWARIFSMQRTDPCMEIEDALWYKFL